MRSCGRLFGVSGGESLQDGVGVGIRWGLEEDALGGPEDAGGADEGG